MSYQSPLVNKHKESSNSNLAGYSSVLLLSTTEEVDEKIFKEKEISTLLLKEKGLINEDLLDRIENTSPFVSSTNRRAFEDEKDMELLLLNDKTDKDGKDKTQNRLKSKVKSDLKLNKSFEKQNIYFTNYEDLAKTFEKSANFHPRLNYRGSGYSPQKSIKISDYYSGIINHTKDKQDDRKDSFFNFFDLINNTTTDNLNMLSPIKNIKTPGDERQQSQVKNLIVNEEGTKAGKTENSKKETDKFSTKKDINTPVIQNNFTNYMTYNYMLHPQNQGYTGFVNQSYNQLPYYPYYNSMPYMFNHFPYQTPQMYNQNRFQTQNQFINMMNPQNIPRSYPVSSKTPNLISQTSGTVKQPKVKTTKSK